MRSSHLAGADATHPAGLSLRHTLRGHTSAIHRIAWSASGETLVSPSLDQTTRFWSEAGELVGMLKDSAGRSIAAAWAPDGERIALAADNDVLRLWHVTKGESIRTRSGGLGQVTSVAWAPDDSAVATGSLKHGVRLWDTEFKNFRSLTKKNFEAVFCLACSPHAAFAGRGNPERRDSYLEYRRRCGGADLGGPSGRRLRSGVFKNAQSARGPAGRGRRHSALGPDRRQNRMRTKRAPRGRELAFVFATTVACSLRSPPDGTVRLWSLELEEYLVSVDEPVGKTWLPGVAFHPSQPVLATLGEEDRVVRIWDLGFRRVTRRLSPASWIAD